MADFSEALGLGALPGPAAWAPPGTTASLGDLSTGGSIDVPLTPPASSASPAAAPSADTRGGIDQRQILALLRPQPPQDMFSPNSQFMAALGAGLNAAGQNWNKPALAALASGAGAALQGGQQWNNQQQDARLKALHAAIAAWKTGDMGAYHQALINLRAAGAPSLTPPPAAPAPREPVAPAPEAAAPAPPARQLSVAPDAIVMARDAIARGAPREAVIKRLREHRIDPSGL
jgi:hypothetical protein